MKECAKICVNECEYTKNWKNVFADVCIFFFDGMTAVIFASLIFAYFASPHCPSESL